MSDERKQFLKYIIILLIVGATLILIGGLSIGRTTITNRRELELGMTARNKLEVISNENRIIKEENARLAREKANLVEENLAAKKKSETLEAYILMNVYIKEGKHDKAKEMAAKIDEEQLPEEVKNKYKEALLKIE